MTVTVTHAGPAGHRSFFVSLTPTRADWPGDMTEAERVALSAHAELLDAACAGGRCVVAGPTLDAGLGIAVWDGIGLEELVELLETEDEMVRQGFFDAGVRAMRVSFER